MQAAWSGLDFKAMTHATANIFNPAQIHFIGLHCPSSFVLFIVQKCLGIGSPMMAVASEADAAEPAAPADPERSRRSRYSRE